MAGIFDTHTHFNDLKYEREGLHTEILVKEAKIAGVERFCCVGFDVKSSQVATRQAAKYKEIYAAVGIHPTEAHKIFDADMVDVDLLANGDKVVAIGEIGLDYYHEPDQKEKQEHFFREQIKIALKYDLPVMLHIRDQDGSIQAYKDAYKICKDMKVKKGIVHCFTQSYEVAEMFLELGFYISIPGVVTFKNATHLHEAVKQISINKLLVETDAPYLTPEPYRGRINEQKYIKNTVEKIAQLKGMAFADVVSTTNLNAKKIFNI